MILCWANLNYFLSGWCKGWDKAAPFADITDMLALRVTLGVILSEARFYKGNGLREVKRLNIPSQFISVSVNCGPVTMDSVLPWRCWCEGGWVPRHEGPGSQDLPPRCWIGSTFRGLLWVHPRAELNPWDGFRNSLPGWLPMDSQLSSPTGAESTWSSEGKETGDDVERPLCHVRANTCQMCAVIAGRSCFRFAVGMSLA